MAVPKVAVIALVAIVAIPILLGYAMNISEVTHTGYAPDGDSVNVTPLLQTDTGYSYTNANIYQLNSNNMHNSVVDGMYPFYESVSNIRSPVFVADLTSTVTNGASYVMADTFNYYQISVENSDSSNYLTIQRYIHSGGGTVWHLYGTYDRVVDVSYDDSTETTSISYYGSLNILQVATYQGAVRLDFTITGNISDLNITASGYQKGTTPSTISGYADIAAGYRLIRHTQTGNQQYGAKFAAINLPENTYRALLTVNLDSITDANYSLAIMRDFRLDKTTNGSDVTWEAKVIPYAQPTTTFNLYYDTNRSDNTYQIYISMRDIKENTAGSTYEYYLDVEFRYVGGWPSLIGEANVYQTYSFTEKIYNDPTAPYLDRIFFWGATETPIIRMDDAVVRAFEFPIINDSVYDPASFKSNPTTTISSISRFGTSLGFAGNDYTISNGNITLGTHQVSVNGIVLDSVPSSTGTGYDNRINGTVISTTAFPSQIVFNGEWVASISTTAQAVTTYTETEWIAGSFAWDGMDQNFLMAGLITSLGVFIALGIYGRRSGARVLPLMLVCGGAALLFFILI